MRWVYLLTTGVFLAATITLLSPVAFAAEQRASTYRLDNYAIQINDDTQFVTAVSGGFVDGVVTTDNTGLMPKKHLAGTTIEPVRARIRPDQFTSFLADSLEGNADNAKGTIYYIDVSGKVQKQRSLNRMTLTELTFPMFTGASRVATALTIGLTPQSVQATDALDGALPPVKQETGPASRHSQLLSDFKIQVPGLPTNRVSTIESFTLRRAIQTVSQSKEPGKAGPWQIPNLVFYMLPNDSEAWIAWHNDFVIQGNCTEANEKTLILDLLAPDLKQTVLEIQGSGVGIVSAKYEQPADGTTVPSRGFRVELYVNSLKIVKNSSSVGSTGNTTDTPPNGNTTPGTTPTIKTPVTRPMIPAEIPKRLPGR